MGAVAQTRWLLGLGLVAITILWHPSAWAKSAAEIGQIAKSVTVLIQGPDTGSGVLIRREGSTYTILTARHVIDAPGAYEVVTPTGKRYPINAQTIQTLPGLDLALLKFTSPDPQAIATLGDSSTLQEGVTLFVAGFPGQGSTVNELTYNFTEGQLTALATKPQTGGYSLVYTNKTFPGMSGGPVFDQEAKVVGIHGAADGQSQTLEKLNARVFMKTGFNLGIPINTFLRAMNPSAVSGGAIALTTPQSPEGSQPIRLQSAPSPNTSSRTSRNTPTSSGATQVTMAGQTPSSSYASDGSSDAFLSALYQYQIGDVTAAMSTVNRAIQLNPRFAAAYSLRGNLRYLAEDYRGALTDFSQAIQLDTRLATAYMGRGLSQSALGNPQAALADYSQALQRSPDSLAYYNRGVIHLNLGNQTAALQDLQQSANLALAEGNQEDYNRAIDALNIAGKECQQSIRKICDR